ncbi:hydantoinase/oxoprolinase family protein [Clostridiales bacterium]|nr:hydantoinase/oxoprolinase family protein [Clostridiales bacterium]
MIRKEQERASYILGIDTGGTFTDCVILDSESKEIICFSKALTTKDDLKIGIQNSLYGLKFHDFEKIALVCLSTTLATNAIVEGKGHKTGLVLMGKELNEPLPADECCFVKGKVDIKGVIVENIDQKEILDTARYLEGKVESIAISCYASVRNPKLEQAVKKLMAKATDMPLFCAHELTGSLGFLERTITSALNACLVKIIRDFICSTESVLAGNQIKAPIMVVKGDGSLMHASMAMERPIETVLSGPAASAIGARHLSGLEDALIIDMGGTTSDIASLHQGTVDICPEGAVVGGWLTKVKAVRVHAYGLGGDSLIQCGASQALTIGPEKAEPLCVTSTLCSNVMEELERLFRSCEPATLTSVCLYRQGNISSCMAFSQTERQIFEAIGGGALCQPTIAGLLHMAPDALNLERLVKTGALIRCSITPTDLLHAMGSYAAFDTKASKKGIVILARASGFGTKAFLRAAADQFWKQLYRFCLQSCAAFEGHDFDLSRDKSALYLLEKAFSQDPEDFLLADFTLNRPIVGVGAPIHAWMPKVAKKLHAPLLIPKYAEVTNAIGAALGKITQSAAATIRPVKNSEEFILYSPQETLTFCDLDHAVEHAKKVLAQEVKVLARDAGGSNIDVTVGVTSIYTQAFNAKKKNYIETKIEAFAVALPSVFA